MRLKRVVVTGMGALTPIGNDLETYWDNLARGQSGADYITRFDADLFKTRFACELKDFDIGQYIQRREARRMDAFTQYAMIVADEAIAQAQIQDVDKNRVGVIWGSGVGGLKTFQDEVQNFERGGQKPRFNVFFIPKMIVDLSAGHISIKHGFGGPNFSTVSACASATNAITDAFNYVRLGKANIIITGGSEMAITESGIGGFNALKALSQRNDDPKTASRPFDKHRDGFVLGEGAGALVLEDLDHALERNAPIYAEIVGAGMSGDAYHITAPHPQGEGAMRVMREALRDADMKPTDIDYINVHGTSTPLGDIAEINAIRQLFGDHVYDLSISSTKSMTGHLLGAAGAVEALACIMAIQRNVIPPTINHSTPDEAIDSKLNLTLNKSEERTVKAALTNTFGFGGHNCSLIFKRYED